MRPRAIARIGGHVRRAGIDCRALVGDGMKKPAGENGVLPLICPTCQNVFAGRNIDAGDTGLLCMGLFSIF
jgi:hypothetical protein